MKGQRNDTACLLDSREVMRLLCVSRRTLQRLRDEKRIGYVIIRGDCRYPPEEVERIIRENAVKTSPEKPEELKGECGQDFTGETGGTETQLPAPHGRKGGQEMKGGTAMEFLDRRTFEDCMRQVFSRLDRQEEMLSAMRGDVNEKPQGTALLEEDTMDNQDVCMLLHVSKRTLQRYRSDGLLPYRMHRHKTYYRRADVELFISTHMREILRDRAQDKADNTKRKSNDKRTNRKN